MVVYHSMYKQKGEIIMLLNAFRKILGYGMTV